MTSRLTSVTGGILAAVFAPFFMAFGFILWDKTWKQHGGSAFGLNLFKCNLASLGFILLCFILGWRTDAKPSSGDNNTLQSASSLDPTDIGFLILSSILGILLGDWAWLEALRILGSTRVLMVDTIKPFSAVLLGRFILKENIKPISFLGICCTAVGVLLVGLDTERNESAPIPQRRLNDTTLDESFIQSDPVSSNGAEGAMNDSKSSSSSGGSSRLDDGDCISVDSSTVVHTPNAQQDREQNLSIENSKEKWTNHVARGYLLAIMNVFLDTYGALLTKQHGNELTTWAINLIRFGSSGIIMLIISNAMKLYYHPRCSRSQAVTESELTRNSVTSSHTRPWYKLPTMPVRSWATICGGVGLVTFTSPLLSNYALFRIALALAITLGSITPLYSLILEWPLKGIRPTGRSTLGAMFAVGGVCVLAVYATPG